MSCPFGAIEVGKEKPLHIKKQLQFDELVSHLKVHFLLLPDSRQGFNTTVSDPGTTSVTVKRLAYNLI